MICRLKRTVFLNLITHFRIHRCGIDINLQPLHNSWWIVQVVAYHIYVWRRLKPKKYFENFVAKCKSNMTKSKRRHQMETFSALLAICEGDSPVTGEFPTQRPVTLSFDVFFDLRLNKRLSKQTIPLEAGDLRRHRAHYDVTVMLLALVEFVQVLILSILWPQYLRSLFNVVCLRLYNFRECWIRQNISVWWIDWGD